MPQHAQVHSPASLLSGACSLCCPFLFLGAAHSGMRSTALCRRGTSHLQHVVTFFQEVLMSACMDDPDQVSALAPQFAAMLDAYCKCLSLCRRPSQHAGAWSSRARRRLPCSALQSSPGQISTALERHHLDTSLYGLPGPAQFCCAPLGHHRQQRSHHHREHSTSVGAAWCARVTRRINCTRNKRASPHAKLSGHIAHCEV